MFDYRFGVNLNRFESIGLPFRTMTYMNHMKSICALRVPLLLLMRVRAILRILKVFVRDLSPGNIWKW